MFIRTERLFLRPGWPEDLEDLLAVLGEDALIRSIGMAGLPRSPADLRAYLSRPREGRLPQFVIHLRDDDGEPKLIGGIGLGRSGEEVELGYWIARAHCGRGYAAEAVRAVLAEARMLGLRQVVAADFVDGDASARVLEQSGFKPTGELRRRFNALRGGEVMVRLYVAVLADKLFDILGVGPQARAS